MEGRRCLIARTRRGRRRRTANGGIDGWMLNAADTHAEAPFQVSRGRSPAQGATARLYARAVVNYWAVIFERFKGFSDRRKGPHRDRCFSWNALELRQKHAPVAFPQSTSRPASRVECCDARSTEYRVVIKGCSSALRNEQPCSSAELFESCPGFFQALLSTKLALTVVAGAAVAAAACTVAALDDATEEPVEGEDDAGLAAGAV
jgi:hypothetical protein